MTEFLPVILPLVWAAILALAVFLYVLLGGYDLGLGVLFPFAPADEDRDAMMSRSRPSGTATRPGSCSAAAVCSPPFPWPTRVMLPALYLPIIFMLLGPHPARRRLRVPLQVRQISLDLWDLAFCRRLDHRGPHAGRHHRRFHSGLRRHGRQIYRRRLRLADAVLAGDRHRPSLRLCAAVRGLADHEGPTRPCANGRAASPASR